MPSRDLFFYSAEFLPLNAGATTPVNVPIQADSQFEMTEIMGDVRALDSDEVVIAAPAILLTLLDTGSGRLLMDRAQIWPNLIGTAERPFLLPMPKTIQANSVLQVTATNNAVAARRVRITFAGYKLFS
jgi:hypothetical protein